MILKTRNGIRVWPSRKTKVCVWWLKVWVCVLVSCFECLLEESRGDVSVVVVALDGIRRNRVLGRLVLDAKRYKSHSSGTKPTFNLLVPKRIPIYTRWHIKDMSRHHIKFYISNICALPLSKTSSHYTRHLAISHSHFQCSLWFDGGLMICVIIIIIVKTKCVFVVKHCTGIAFILSSMQHENSHNKKMVQLQLLIWVETPEKIFQSAANRRRGRAVIVSFYTIFSLSRANWSLSNTF